MYNKPLTRESSSSTLCSSRFPICSKKIIIIIKKKHFRLAFPFPVSEVYITCVRLYTQLKKTVVRFYESECTTSAFLTSCYIEITSSTIIDQSKKTKQMKPIREVEVSTYRPKLFLKFISTAACCTQNSM